MSLRELRHVVESIEADVTTIGIMLDAARRNLVELRRACGLPAPEAPKKEKAPARCELSCSFCGKSQREVKTLIAGPVVYVCNECIGLCNEIIADEARLEANSKKPFIQEETP